MRHSDNGSSEDPQRRIPISKKERISFRPGKEHPLDVQIEEAQAAREKLEEQLAVFLGRLHALASLEGVADRWEDEDEALRRYLAAHYADYFHVDHLRATFLWLRRRRAIARLQAAQEALVLAQELLAPDPFVDELLSLLAERDPEQVEVDRAQVTGNVQAARAQLARYEARLQEIRAAMRRGNGWIERTYVRKAGWRPEVIALAYAIRNERKHKTPIPPDVLARVDPEVAECLLKRQPIPRRLKEQATVETVYGPYLKYRWTEGGDSPTYTISLGQLSRRPEGPLPFRPYIRFERE